MASFDSAAPTGARALVIRDPVVCTTG